MGNGANGFYRALHDAVKILGRPSVSLLFITSAFLHNSQICICKASFCKKKKRAPPPPLPPLSLFRIVRGGQDWRLVNWMKVLAVFRALFRVASPETKAEMSAASRAHANRARC